MKENKDDHDNDRPSQKAYGFYDGVCDSFTRSGLTLCVAAAAADCHFSRRKKAAAKRAPASSTKLIDTNGR